jgi:hypothetical protein
MHDIDVIARLLGNFDENEFAHGCRFCIRCGTKNLQRSARTTNREGKPLQGRDYWCTLCGFSFNVRMSVEWALALDLFRDHRRNRTMPRYQEQYVDPEVMAAWKEEYEKPTAATTWPAASRWSLGEKLKAALSG